MAEEFEATSYGQQSPEEELRDRKADAEKLPKMAEYERAVGALADLVRRVLPELSAAVRAVKKVEPVIHTVYDDIPDEVGFFGVPWEELGLENMREFLKAAKHLKNGADRWARINARRIAKLEAMVAED